MLNILVVDDEYITRLGIKTVIKRTNNDWNVVAEASNGIEALKAFSKSLY